MAKHVNLARMIVVGGGTGPLTLTQPAPASLTFEDAGVSDGDVVSYGLRTTLDSEVGYGTYSAGVLTRTTILDSTNGGAAIDVVGSGEVFITMLADDLASATYNGLMAASDKSKLDGIAAGATANATDAQLRARSSHTGTQAISTVSGLQAALDAKLAATKAAVSGVIGGNAVTSGAVDASIAWDVGTSKATFTFDGTAYGTVWPISINGEAAHSYSSTYAYSSTRLNEELPSYYTDIPARLGYTPARTDAVTTTVNGLMIAADKVKLNGIAAGAQVNPGVATTSANGLMASADKTKLNGVATGATANSTDAQLRDRSTHTGTQEISTVSGLGAALASKLDLSGGAMTGKLELETVDISSAPLNLGAAAARPANGRIDGDIWTSNLSGIPRLFAQVGTSVLSLSPTASQAEAEAGSSTSERSWTPQRVRQNVLAAPVVKQGGGTGQDGSNINIGWSTALNSLRAQANTLDLGRIWTDNGTAYDGSVSGYIKLPNGYIIQWGPLNGSGGDYTLNFPVAFPTALRGVQCQAIYPSLTGGQLIHWVVTSATQTLITVRPRYVETGGTVGVSSGATGYWMAIGL